MSIAEFYLMNSRYAGGAGLDFYNPFDDDYYDRYHDHYYGDDDHNSDYSDYMNSLDGRDEYELDLPELCIPSTMFPDPKKFPVEWIRRSTKIKSDHLHPLTHQADVGKQISSRGVYSECSDKLELPIFEQLWESLFYLKEIASVGKTRVDSPSAVSDISDEMVKAKGILFGVEQVKGVWESSIECFSIFSQEAKEIADHWFGWCNDIFVDTLQSCISTTLPYIVWEKIIRNISRIKYSENRILQTKIGTLSEDKDAQIFERYLMRECILRVCDLTIIFNQFLYAELIDYDNTFSKIKGTLPVLFEGLSSAFDRLRGFIEKPVLDCSSRHLDYSVHSSFLMNDLKTLTDLNGNEFETNLDILKVVQCNAHAECQNDTNHFVILIADHLIENSYHILCFEKDCIDSKDNLSYHYEKGIVSSVEPPLLYCFGDLVACVGVNDQNNVEFTLRDMSDKTQKLELIEIVKGWKEVYPALETVSLSNLRIAALVKCESKVFIMCAIGESCLMSIYHIEYHDFFLDKKVKKQNHADLLNNAVPLGVVGTTAFVMNLKENSLSMYDIEKLEDDFASVHTKIKFENGRDWKLLSNGDPKSELFVLHKGAKLQVRKLDNELTLIKEVTLNLFDFMSTLLPYERVDLSLFGNIVYGARTSDSEIRLNANKDFLNDQTKDPTKDNINFRHFLRNRCGKIREKHFLVDIMSAETELVGVDWMSFVADTYKDNRLEEFFDDYARVEIILSGFNKKGELAKLVIESAIDNNTVIIFKRCVLRFATARVVHSQEDAKSIGLLRIQNVKDLLKVEEEKREALRLEQEKMKKEMEERREKERVEWEKERKAKEDAVKKTKEYVQKGTKVKATIKKWLWLEGYGFATIDIDVGLEEPVKQDIFFHKSCFTKKERDELGPGTTFLCKLNWDPKRPRPNAIDVKMLQN